MRGVAWSWRIGLNFCFLFVQAKRMEGDQKEIIQTGMRLLLLLTSNRNDGATKFNTSLIPLIVRLFFQFGANYKPVKHARVRLELANWIEFCCLFVQAKRMEGD